MKNSVKLLSFLLLGLCVMSIPAFASQDYSDVLSCEVIKQTEWSKPDQFGAAGQIFIATDEMYARVEQRGNSSSFCSEWDCPEGEVLPGLVKSTEYGEVMDYTVFAYQGQQILGVAGVDTTAGVLYLGSTEDRQTSSGHGYEIRYVAEECYLQVSDKPLEVSVPADQKEYDCEVCGPTSDEREEGVVVDTVAADVSPVGSIMPRIMDQSSKNNVANQPLFIVVKTFGFEWKQDRKKIATMLGIENYVGSYEQNMLLKKQLLELLVVTE